MYICMKNNQNTKKVIEELHKLELAPVVDSLSMDVYIDTDLQKKYYTAYIAVWSGKLYIVELATALTKLEIDLKDVQTIYNLD